MKLSKETLAILTSFINFYSSISIKKGNVLTTANVGKENNRTVLIKSILANAEVQEEFPVDFAIYDLQQFIKIIDTFSGEPDFQFTESSVIISSGNKSIKYSFCDPSIILSVNPPTSAFPEPIASFIVDSKEFIALKKASSIMKHDDLFIKRRDNFIDLILTTVNEGSTATYNDYTISIECDEDRLKGDFNLKFSMKDLSLVLNDDYAFKLVPSNGGREILILDGLEDTKITYYIAQKR